MLCYFSLSGDGQAELSRGTDYEMIFWSCVQRHRSAHIVTTCECGVTLFLNISVCVCVFVCNA